MTLKRSSKHSMIIRVFLSKQRKISIFKNYSSDFIFSLLQEIMVPPLKVLTYLQKSPGWTLCWYLDRVSWKINPNFLIVTCHIFFWGFPHVFLSFSLLKSPQKHCTCHKDHIRRSQLKLLSHSFIVGPL